MTTADEHKFTYEKVVDLLNAADASLPQELVIKTDDDLRAWSEIRSAMDFYAASATTYARHEDEVGCAFDMSMHVCPCGSTEYYACGTCGVVLSVVTVGGGGKCEHQIEFRRAAVSEGATFTTYGGVDTP